MKLSRHFHFNSSFLDSEMYSESVLIALHRCVEIALHRCVVLHRCVEIALHRCVEIALHRCVGIALRGGQEETRE